MHSQSKHQDGTFKISPIHATIMTIIIECATMTWIWPCWWSTASAIEMRDYSSIMEERCRNRHVYCWSCAPVSQDVMHSLVTNYVILQLFISIKFCTSGGKHSYWDSTRKTNPITNILKVSWTILKYRIYCYLYKHPVSLRTLKLCGSSKTSI